MTVGRHHQHYHHRHRHHLYNIDIYAHDMQMQGLHAPHAGNAYCLWYRIPMKFDILA